MNIARTPSFPGAYIGSDHNLLMITFPLHLKRIGEPKQTILKSNLGKLKDRKVLKIFQTMTGGKYTPLTIMNNEGADMNSLITTLSTAVSEIACEILGHKRRRSLLKSIHPSEAPRSRSST